MSNSQIAENKLKKYKLNNDSQNVVDKSETIELKTATETPNEACQLKTSNDTNLQTTTYYKIENILDFNLKFNSISLERLYKKSYLPVTRFLFRKYLFFLISFISVWIIYFYFDNDLAGMALKGERYQFDLLDADPNTSMIANATYTHHIRVSYFNDIEYTQTFLPMFIYLIVVGIVLTAILILISIGEMKESKYRKLENKLKMMESKKQVNTKVAEEDLQKALKEVAEMEKEYQDLSQRLNESYQEVSKSREIYSKLSNPIALVVIVMMFGLCFMGFVYPPVSLTPISHFVWFCISLLMLYLIFPFQMSVPVVFGVFFSFLFEIFAIKKQVNNLELLTLVPQSDYNGWSSSHYSSTEMMSFIAIKFLLHLSLHLIGVYLKLSIQAIKRDTFLKVI